MSKPLYELTAQYKALVDRIDDVDGYLVDDMALDALGAELEHKGAGIVHVLKTLEDEETAIGREVERLTARKRTLAQNRERLRDYVKRTMLDNQVTKLKAGTFSITVSNGPERVVIDDESKVPDSFMRIKKEPNKTAILEAFASAGECVPGTHVERSVALKIR